MTDYKKMSIRKKIVNMKIYLIRSLGYISIINSVMILFLTLTSLDKYGFNISIKKYFIPIIIILLITLVFVGWLEDKLGFYKEELGEVSKRNPQINLILKELKEIKDDRKNNKLPKDP